MDANLFPPFDLIGLRRSLRLTQTEMARRMHMTLRPYQELERSLDRVQQRHVDMAYLAAMRVAIEREDITLIPEGFRSELLKVASFALGRTD